MPLTTIQRDILALLASQRTPDSYLAGGAAIHFTPDSICFSSALDFFNDSAVRVATAFADDNRALLTSGYTVDIEISQPGFIRAIVQLGDSVTRVDWAHDSAWRFMPAVRDELGGFLMHPVDLAINKTLALAGREEARDYVDTLYVHQHTLALGAIVWAAAGKDPGFSPLSLLEMLKRRGRPRAEEIARLDLATDFDLHEAKRIWLIALDDADAFVRSRPISEAGCLYYSTRLERFVVPNVAEADESIVAHFGRPGGVLPQVV